MSHLALPLLKINHNKRSLLYSPLQNFNFHAKQHYLKTIRINIFCAQDLYINKIYDMNIWFEQNDQIIIMRWVDKWMGVWIPHCRFSGQLIGSLAVPNKVQHRSWVYHDPDRQTWPQTGRGRWWWCMELNIWAQTWIQTICWDTHKFFLN